METMQGQRTDEVVAESIAILAQIQSEAPTERTPAFPIAIPAKLWPQVTTVVTIAATSTIDESVLESFQPKWRWAMGLGFVPFTGIAIQQITSGGPLATVSLWWLLTLGVGICWTVVQEKRQKNN